ncbi:hypothetical protein Tco_0098041 [Tanacetum coccineum]
MPAPQPPLVTGHFKKDCPKLKNGNCSNQRRNGNAPSKVRISQKSQENSKNEQTRTRESGEYKAEARKVKASKHGHENQKSTKPKPKTLAHFSFMKPQGPILQIPKVIYNLKKGKEREGLKESKGQRLKDWRAGQEILEASFRAYK